MSLCNFFFVLFFFGGGGGAGGRDCNMDKIKIIQSKKLNRAYIRPCTP